MPLLQGRLPWLADRYIYTAFCARCARGCGAALAAQSVPLCAGSRHHFLFSRAARRRRPPHPQRAGQTQILRSRHGPRPLLRSCRRASASFRRASSRNTTRWWRRTTSWSSTAPAREQTAKTDARHRGLQNRPQSALRHVRRSRNRHGRPGKDKSNLPVPVAEPVAPAAKTPASEQEDAQNFFGEPLVGSTPAS